MKLIFASLWFVYDLSRIFLTGTPSKNRNRNEASAESEYQNSSERSKLHLRPTSDETYVVVNLREMYVPCRDSQSRSGYERESNSGSPLVRLARGLSLFKDMI